MIKKAFKFKHGNIEGIYQPAKKIDTPLVVITNGHNGFYNYGFFPYLQKVLGENGIASYSYNFSHGGIVGDVDYFTELELYEQNSMRLETADLYEVVKHLQEAGINHNGLILLSHSMGSFPTLFAAKKLLKENIVIGGVILLSPISTLDRFPQEVINNWEKDGVWYVKNNRTKQDLPHGVEFLQEVKQANGVWSLRKAISGVNTSFLIIHGDKDEAVPDEQSREIHQWITSCGNPSTLKIIPYASHTFNTRHPFEGSSPELEMILSEIISWIQKLVNSC